MTLEKFAEVYDVSIYELFFRAFRHKNGEPTLKDVDAIKMQLHLYETNSAIPDYVEEFLNK